MDITFAEDDFLPASGESRRAGDIMRESVGFWKDGFRRLRRNKLAVVSFFVIIIVIIIAFAVPAFFPYDYKEQIRGAENVGIMRNSPSEAAGSFPHLLGTDTLGRDIAARIMIGSRISLLVGLVSSLLILLIGSLYGAAAGYFGGYVDIVMMRVVDLIYSIPDILIIILLSVTLKYPLSRFSGHAWVSNLGVGLISIFIVFALLYWVGMARIVRGQVMSLKENDYVMAAKAMGAGSWHIIRRHLLKNCIGTLIVTTTLQIPSAIFTESFLSFLGLGVSAPLPSLGSMCSDALSGMYTYPYRLVAPAALLSLIILSLNLFGDGLRDAFDPRMKTSD
ncbi:MAG: ABC transporter permease [Clostridiales bacterium]|jgi:oligopeptide transport system permease protein|nr:ABC transporter permease [Clostridiales bacterium]